MDIDMHMESESEGATGAGAEKKRAVGLQSSYQLPFY
jgi:hypothetical protein